MFVSIVALFEKKWDQLPLLTCSLFFLQTMALTLSSITSSATFGAAAEGACGEGALAESPPSSVAADAIDLVLSLPLLNRRSRFGFRDAGAIDGAEGVGRGAPMPMPSERARWTGAALLLMLLLAEPQSIF